MTKLPDIFKDSDQNEFIQSDYERSRATLYKLLEDGKEAIELALQIAQNTEHPRAIEVLSGAMKTVADINDKIMDLNKKVKDMNKRENHRDPGQGSATTNYIFTGSTVDLQRAIQEQEKAEAIDITPNKD